MEKIAKRLAKAAMDELLTFNLILVKVGVKGLPDLQPDANGDVSLKLALEGGVHKDAQDLFGDQFEDMYKETEPLMKEVGAIINKHISQIDLKSVVMKRMSKDIMRMKEEMKQEDNTEEVYTIDASNKIV